MKLVALYSHPADVDAFEAEYANHLKLVDKIPGLKLNQKGKLEQSKEEGKFDRYHYNVRNLDVFDLDTVKAAFNKLIKS